MAKSPPMRSEEGHAWRPVLPGWSNDVLPFYERMAADLPAGAQCVEVGVAWGRSAVFLASQFVALGKSATIWIVDEWSRPWWGTFGTGSEHWLSTLVEHATVAELDLLHVVRAQSQRAARMFDPGELDFVFIDGDHRAESVRADLAAWRPKMKPRGILAGHDYAAPWPGVIEAVDGAFGRDKIAVQETCWWFRAS
jgi:predicted O-methyltransferase YrrM